MHSTPKNSLRPRRVQRLLPVALLLALPALLGARGGCAGDDVSLGNDGAASKKGEPCGPASCAAGEVCCNASCGICTPPGGACIAIACAEDGGQAPYDACAGLTCGDECSPCDPADLDCVAPAAVHACNSSGDCRPEEPACGGPGGEPCGANVCAAGEVCCNSSCGICTPPGGACIEIACGPSCEAMDARSGPEECLAHLGFTWSGLTCEPVTCTCVGSDCGALFADRDECLVAYAACPEPPSCGGFAGEACPDGLACTDDPRDTCDPGNGGADCPGVCVRERELVTEACAKTRGDTCSTDADCVGGGCGGETCHNPAFGPGVSTCECVAPSDAACGCVEGMCGWFR